MCYKYNINVLLHLTEDKLREFGELVAVSKNQEFVKHIGKIPTELSSMFYEYYLHDFVQDLVLPFNEEAFESVFEVKMLLLFKLLMAFFIQLIFTVIKEIVITYEPATDIRHPQPFPLINAITAVHLAYNLIEQEIFWLAELSEELPELPNILKDKDILSSGKTVCAN